MATPSIELKTYTKVGLAEEDVVNGVRETKMTGQADKTARKQDNKLRLLKVCRKGSYDELLALIKDQDLVNQKIKGTTPLHEACSYGHLECVRALMGAGACPEIRDVRGFNPAHCSVYDNQSNCLKVLLDFRPPANSTWSKLTPDTLSEYNETLLHIACLRGNLDLAKFLVRRGANLMALDKLENTVLHYAASSDNSVLMKWLIRLLKENKVIIINTPNKYGQTAAHRASVLGCPEALSVLVDYQANFTLQDKSGYSPVDLARLLGNNQCYDIGSCSDIARPFPSSAHSVIDSYSKSTDNLSSSQSLSASEWLHSHQRSFSSTSSSTTPLQRQSSITGAPRPRNLSIVKRYSKGSLSSGDDANMYITKKAALQVEGSLKHKKSRSWDNTQQVLYNTTAFEPPPDILFVPPIEKKSLSQNDSRFFCEPHNIKIKISPEHWTIRKQPPEPGKLDPTPPEPTVDMCVAAAMHLNQPFPSGFTIVSPIYFISCKSHGPCEAEVILPHAVHFDKRRLCILSTTTISPTLQPDVWSPSDRTLSKLETDLLEADPHRVKFRTSLAHPSLYAVAVNEKDFGLEPHIPLRCTLFVSYPNLQPTASVSGFYVTTYLGMSLKTVHTAVTNQTTKDGNKFEEKTFTLSRKKLLVEAELTNQSDEWIMTPQDNGEFSYNQLALTQETNKDSLSHLPAYPPHTQFFVEPRGVAAAVKCRVRVLSSDGKEISYIRVVPFSPSRELTPPPNHSTPVSIPEDTSVTKESSEGPSITTV